MNSPKRRHQVMIDIHADSFEELKAQLDVLMKELKPDGNGPGLFGGVSSGGTWHHKVNKEQTPESYRAELEKYNAWERA